VPRYRLLIEYDGGHYAGWQRQADIPTVQQAIEKAVLALSGESVTVKGAGRTDAGVHALGQVAHLDLSREWTGNKLREALNAHLTLAGDSVAILAVEPVADDFDARFSARARHYLYRILNRRAPPAIDLGRVWHVKRALDAAAMHEAAQLLLGKHDFSTFRASLCQAKSPVKTLARLDVARNDDSIEVRASAPSFLHNQVRSMVGSLKLVGEGSWSADDLKSALIAADRTRCGPVAPPDGLYLVRVDY
jgi:tRNA pseudouridine38-40 synthase